MECFELVGVLWVCGKGAWGNEELHGFGEFSLFHQFHDFVDRLFGGGFYARVFIVGIWCVVEEVPFAFSVVLETISHQLCLCLLGVFGELVWSRWYDTVEVEEDFP